MKRHTLVTTGVVAMLFLLTLGALPASADMQTFTLGTSNLGSGFNGPFGTVTIDLTSSTTATVTFQANDSGVSGSAMGYQFIDGSAADLNVNGAFSFGSFSLAQLATFHTNSLKNTSSGNVDGFGSFNLQLNLNDGSGSAVDSMSFVLTATGGNSWSTAANVLLANANGGTIAAHMADCTGTPCTIDNTGATTGYASNGSEVPDGGMTLMLFGGALVGLATLRRGFGV